jgi:hypothetical protein
MILSRLTTIGAAVALTAGIAAFAPAGVQAQETPAPAPAPAVGETRANQRSGAATLTGCLVRESDFRKAHNLGDGGGIGMGDELVLADARDTAPGTSATGTCSESTFTGTAYRITGGEEDKMKTLVGRRIEVTGFFQPDRDGESKLPEEVSVRTFREYTVTATAEVTPAAVPTIEAREVVAAEARPEPAPAPVVEARVEQPAPMPTPTPEPVAVAAREELPATASVLPLIGLIGLLSLGSSAVLIRRKN